MLPDGEVQRVPGIAGSGCSIHRFIESYMNVKKTSVRGAASNSAMIFIGTPFHPKGSIMAKVGAICLPFAPSFATNSSATSANSAFATWYFTFGGCPVGTAAQNFCISDRRLSKRARSFSIKRKTNSVFASWSKRGCSTSVRSAMSGDPGSPPS